MAVARRRQSSLYRVSAAVVETSTLLLTTVLLIASTPYVCSRDVRLAGSSVPNEGRLEVRYNGIWGTVCDDHFDYLDAGVVCNSLGFGYKGTVIGSRYGPGTGRIWLDNVQCLGNETSIAYCSHNGWGVHNCNHSEDVSVSCGASPVQHGPLPNVDNFYIVAVSYMRNLYQVDATTGATHQLLPLGTAHSPVALAYDSTARMLYWTDVAAKTVNRYSMITNTSTVIYRDPTNVAVYYGLAIDTGRHKLYLADAAQSGGKVAEMSTDGTGYRVLISDINLKPRGLVLHNENRTLYWTDWSSSPAIYRSSVVSPARQTLITGFLHWPNALAIDFTAGVMYWGDAGLHKIESANLDGTGRRILLAETRAHYFAFQFHAGSIYFTDWTSAYIRRLHTATRATSIITAATPLYRQNGFVFMPDARSTSAPVTVKSTSATTMTTTTRTTTTTTRTTSTTSKPAPDDKAASAMTSQSTSTTTTPTAQSTTAKSSATTSNSTPNPQASNPEPSKTMSETTIIILTACVVGGIVVVIVVIAVAIIACRCARRTRQTPSQPVNRPAQEPQHRPAVCTVNSVYDEIDFGTQKNDMYIHPNYSRTPGAYSQPYQDLDVATRMNTPANSRPYQRLNEATMHM